MDQTHEVFSRTINELSKQYDAEWNILNWESSELMASTKSRIESAKNPDTRKTEPRLGDTLAASMTARLKGISSAEKNLVRLEDEIATHKQQLETLTMGSESAAQNAMELS